MTEGAPLNADRHTRSTPDGAGERVDLPITGMTCAACARRIETKLTRAPGVRRAAVNFATSRATVEYDPTATGTGRLVDTVRDDGYGVAGTARADFVVDDSARPSGRPSARLAARPARLAARLAARRPARLAAHLAARHCRFVNELSAVRVVHEEALLFEPGHHRADRLLGQTGAREQGLMNVGHRRRSPAPDLLQDGQLQVRQLVQIFFHGSCSYVLHA